MIGNFAHCTHTLCSPTVGYKSWIASDSCVWIFFISFFVTFFSTILKYNSKIVLANSSLRPIHANIHKNGVTNSWIIIYYYFVVLLFIRLLQIGESHTKYNNNNIGERHGDTEAWYGGVWSQRVKNGFDSIKLIITMSNLKFVIMINRRIRFFLLIKIMSGVCCYYWFEIDRIYGIWIIVYEYRPKLYYYLLYLFSFRKIKNGKILKI